MSLLSTRRAVYALIGVFVIAAAAMVITGRSFAAPAPAHPIAAPQSPTPAIFPTMVRVA
jgi:hypothetical protein